MITTLRLLALPAVLVAVAVAGCEPPPADIIDTPVLNTCENNDQCSAGTLCVAGQCLIASCDPAVEAVCGIDNLGENRDPNCCKIFENCNVLTLTCERDPNAVGIGCPPEDPACIPCEENRDCVADLGFQSFCSGGRCFAQEGRTDCTQDFNRPEGERCDRTEFFCVPASGACSFCGPDFPELCCETGQVCDSVSGQCVAVGDRECEEATVSDDCRLGELCDALGRCVQCITNTDCGPNTICNEGTGLCESTIGVCEDDGDCNDPFFCVRGRCEIPECVADRDCDDRRELCTDFTCVLPAAVCEETDEPNNTPAAATEIAIATGYGGALCRGDQDFLRFPVQPQKRYSLTVTIASNNTPFNGIALTLTDTTGAVESTATYSSTAALPLVGVTGPAESGFFTLAINSGGNTARDEWAYTVVIREDDASAEADCSAAAQAGQEPNDAFATAIALTPGTPQTFSRCGTADVDFFKVDVPELHGVEFTVDGFQNAEGNLNVELFRSANLADVATRGQGTGNSEVVAAPEGSVTYFARVFLFSATGALQNQLYSVTARAVPRPEACNVDVGENDGSAATAVTMTTVTDAGLVSGSVAARRCNAQDVDHVRFTVPGNLGGTLRLIFTHAEGDLALDLLDAAGTQLPGLTANASNAQNGAEVLDVPLSTTDQTYVARIRLGSASGAPITAQPWRLELGTFDAAACLVSEPAPDGTFATARCLGDFAPAAGIAACPNEATRLPLPMVGDFAACQADATGPGCFLTCGNADTDIYRIGSLEAGRTITVRLDYATADGLLNFQLARLSGTSTLSVLTTALDTDRDGVVTLERVTSGSTAEHAIIVRPEGATGHEGQVYALNVAVSAACIADAGEAGQGNQTAATATLVRATPQSGEADIVRVASLCSGDLDVYELFTAVGEDIVVTLEGLPGAKVQLGTRPTNLNSLPVRVANATATADEAGDATLSFASTAVQHYLIVERSVATGPVGNYTMTLSFPVTP
jgi:hypothetical protein